MLYGVYTDVPVHTMLSATVLYFIYKFLLMWHTAIESRIRIYGEPYICVAGYSRRAPYAAVRQRP